MILDNSATASPQNARRAAAAADVRDYYRTLLKRLPLSCSHTAESDPDTRLTTLGITSCYRGEGVSTVASELAVAAADISSGPVLLVDMNVVNPVIHRLCSVRLSPGLCESLSAECDEAAAIQATAVPNLFVLSAGESKTDRPVFQPKQMVALLEKVRAEYGLVIFDLPPVCEPDTSTSTAALLDGVLLVMEAERVRQEVAVRAKQLLQREQVSLLGVVLNKQPQHVPEWLYRTL